MPNAIVPDITPDRPFSPDDVMRRAAHPAIASSIVRDYQGYVDRRSPGFDRHLPITFIPVIIGFGAPMRIRDDGAPPNTGDRHTTFAAGLYEQPSVAETDGMGMGVQVDFTPAAARRFFGVPMHEIANRIVELDDIFGDDARVLVEQLRDAPSWARRFELIDAFLLPRMATAPSTTPGVARAWRRLAETRGSASIGALASDAGWSRKHLIEKFRDEIGLPPKAIARIMRFNRALRLLRNDATPRWTDIAYASGYYDQAHMIRDFRAFAGATPTEYARTLDPATGTSLAAI
jgi:AraC-like DNA-binding protein